MGLGPTLSRWLPSLESSVRLPDARNVIVHTGQHYDRMMSEIFLAELGVPRLTTFSELGPEVTLSRRQG